MVAQHALTVMRTLLHLEHLAILIACYASTVFIGHPWWLFLALLLLPDISMLGYLAGARVGAVVYNIFHHQGIAVALILLGWYGQYDWFFLAGIVMLGHSAMDRIFGYGLKYFSGFKDTHLGQIGR